MNFKENWEKIIKSITKINAVLIIVIIAFFVWAVVMTIDLHKIVDNTVEYKVKKDKIEQVLEVHNRHTTGIKLGIKPQ